MQDFIVRLIACHQLNAELGFAFESLAAGEDLAGFFTGLKEVRYGLGLDHEGQWERDVCFESLSHGVLLSGTRAMCHRS
ncbi:hypothetical protein SHL_00001 [Pseudomonas phage shl2]|uniref:Uncharacterized protein n=1 Tax=Pseudomonas phage shl2 TaxID=1729933 RepID=A0A170PB89_9CAUD|nr:hypothetical protein HOV57_gp01 [Pseudomonas phage shl2]CUR50691.1 hypothetical protein SHL_00001 [Pseudomonas phage shl2]